jgi:hypothetical protein
VLLKNILLLQPFTRLHVVIPRTPQYTVLSKIKHVCTWLWNFVTCLCLHSVNFMRFYTLRYNCKCAQLFCSLFEQLKGILHIIQLFVTAAAVSVSDSGVATFLNTWSKRSKWPPDRNYKRKIIAIILLN